MRSLLLLSLAILIGLAPVAIVPTRVKDAAEAAAKTEVADGAAGDSAGESTGDSTGETAGTPGTDDESEPKPAQKAPKAPRKTQLIKLTPNQLPGSGNSMHEDDDESSLLPDWPPALYARRLPMATVPPAPPAEPALSSELRAGHLTLPPPSA